jgi:phytoene dehydrogenase-like protein
MDNEKTKTGILSRSLSRRQFLGQSAIASLAALGSGSALSNINIYTDNASPMRFDDNSRKEIVVVGGGIGGMASATLLAKAGHKVTVLEMHERIGGQGRSKTFSGLIFSMGPQYCWDFGPGAIGDRFIKHLGIEDSSGFIPMAQDGFETFFIGKSGTPQGVRKYEIPMGWSRFKDYMMAAFPGDRRMGAFFDDTQESMAEVKAMFGGQNDPDLTTLLGKFLTLNPGRIIKNLKMFRFNFLSLGELFDLYQISEEARRVLYGHGGIFIENESVVSAVAYIIATLSYHQGAYYPRGGFHTLFNDLQQSVIENGGQVFTNSKVVKLVSSGRQVTAARCADGRVFPCDAVVSDISPRLTLKLLGSNLFSPHYSYQPSHGTVACCVGLKRGISTLRNEIDRRNFWWIEGPGSVNYENIDMTKPPTMLFIASETARGYGFAGSDRQYDGLTVYCCSNYDHEKRIYAEGEGAVKQYKELLAKNMIDIIETQVIPGVKDHVLFAEVISTVDAEREMDAEKGNAYGRRLTTHEVLKMPFMPGEGYDNVLNVSATRNGAGIAAGIGTAVKLLKQLTGKTI